MSTTTPPHLRSPQWPTTPAGAEAGVASAPSGGGGGASRAEAIANEALDRIEKLLAEFGDALTEPDIRRVADLCLKHRHWNRAAELLARVPDASADLIVRLKRRLAVNMAAMQQHRPAVYELIMAAGGLPLADDHRATRYRFVEGADGQLTLADCAVPTHPTILAPDGDPEKGAREILAELVKPMANGAPIGLCGIGDGCVLTHLARVRPALFMDQRLAIHVIEPDVQLLTMCLALYDMTGPHGAIEDTRFRWYVGASWATQYREEILSDLMLPPPATLVSLGDRRATIKGAIAAVSEQYSRLSKDLIRRNDAHYASFGTRELIELLGDEPPRRPRVLLMTSRFTTVLQYTARDAASAFERLGWDVDVLVEPSPAHRVMSIAMQQRIDAFKPDLLFISDHLRHEYGPIIPAGLPVVTWMQDHLPNLMNRRAGESVRPDGRDFVLTFASPMFIDTHAYPASRVIDVPMMWTHDRGRPERWTCDGEDLIYVSNVSGVPADLARSVIETTPKQVRRYVGACCDRVMELYEQGQSLATLAQVRDLFNEFVAAQGGAVDPGTREQIVNLLWNPLNIALYRQQALGWAMDAARELDLTVGIYGRGWEHNPRFATLSRGAVEHGEPLADLTRRSKINLVLEPYLCFTHQRMLDALAAGGFMLVRDHPANSLLQRLADILDEHLSDDIETTEAALDAIRDDKRAELSQVIKQAACLDFSGAGDPVRQVRCWQRAGAIVARGGGMPHLNEIAFHDPATCRDRIAQYIVDDDARRRISEAQWSSVRERVTFESGLRRVVAEMHARLRSEAECAASDCCTDDDVNSAADRSAA